MPNWTVHTWSETLGGGFDLSPAEDTMGLFPRGREKDGTLKRSSLNVTSSFSKAFHNTQPPTEASGISYSCGNPRVPQVGGDKKHTPPIIILS